MFSISTGYILLFSDETYNSLTIRLILIRFSLITIFGSNTLSG